MGVIGVVLLVFFVIVCVFLVLLVLIQDNGENGMGGLLGGRGTTAFGSHSGNVLTKATFIFAALFFVLTISLALINKKPKIASDLVPVTSVETENKESTETSTEWWEESKETTETQVESEIAE